ncbi:hypothetical protein V1264_017646 [Littorina saxatilis]|uniref:Uncharacterized protein n=1 Tax=Littorina saxatilis TaxID=31220 RepID=A0AAN9GFM1_9CAEN
MDQNAAKGVAIVILFGLTVVFGWLPIWLHHRGSLSASGSARRKIVLDVLNCFAGGVFLGTCLLHLLAEGREQFEEYKKKVGYESDFPFYETLAAVGLFLIAYVEKIGFAIISFTRRTDDNELIGAKEPTVNGSPSIVYSPSRPDSVGYGAVSDTEDRAAPVSSAGSSHQNGSKTTRGESCRDVSVHVHGGTKCENKNGERQDLTSSVKVVTSTTSDPRLTASVEFQWSGHGQGEGKGHAHAHDQAEQEHHHHHHSLMASTSCNPTNISQMSVVRALLLLVALSFHTVFDGLAVGLQDTAAEVWEVLLAISIHKSLVAFCLGLELAAASPSTAKRPLLFMLLFAFISPIGIAIGMGVTSGHVDERAQMLASSVLQALATGTFLYVTFFEILGQKFAHNHDAATKTWVEVVRVTVAVLGFGCMVVAKLLDKD